MGLGCSERRRHHNVGCTQREIVCAVDTVSFDFIGFVEQQITVEDFSSLTNEDLQLLGGQLTPDSAAFPFDSMGLCR